jgi:hypothetical protein
MIEAWSSKEVAVALPVVHLVEDQPVQVVLDALGPGVPGLGHRRDLLRPLLRLLDGLVAIWASWSSCGCGPALAASIGSGFCVGGENTFTPTTLSPLISSGAARARN